MAENHTVVAEVRGRGLMLALELVGEGLVPDPRPPFASSRRAGRAACSSARAASRRTPSASLRRSSITREAADEAADIMEEALAEVGRHAREGRLMQTEEVDARRAVDELKELAELTGGPDGARRVAWTEEWEKAREWFRGKLEEIEGITEVETDEAGNVWATAPGDSERAVLLGGHIDSVPNGGWLDGALNIVGALEVMRVLAPQERPVTLRLVDWADEEGARFGRSLFGSGAAAGALEPDDVRNLKDSDGVALPDALAGARRGPRQGQRGADGSSRTPPPTWSCTSSRVRFSNGWTCRSGWCSAPSASSGTPSALPASTPIQARRRWR